MASLGPRERRGMSVTGRLAVVSAGLIVELLRSFMGVILQSAGNGTFADVLRFGNGADARRRRGCHARPRSRAERRNSA